MRYHTDPASIIKCAPPTSKKFQDLTGKLFGQLEVIEFTGIKNHPCGKHSFYWKCLCSCGNITYAATAHLSTNPRRGITTSCGCRADACLALGRQAHNHNHECGSVHYPTWRGMMKRCYNPKDRCWRRYGQRGITVCAGWRASVKTFTADIGPKPSPAHSLNRINNDGGYWCGHCEECTLNCWPSNCNWATPGEQQRNTCRNRMLTLNGETKCVTDWAIHFGLSPDRVFKRIYAGWQIERALFTPFA